MALRNISPPPGIKEEDLRCDLIGETCYSKLTCIDIIKRIMSQLINYCSVEHNPEVANEDFDFDDDLCKFMDMTVEEDVLCFIKNFAFIEPICHAISINKSDRFNELFIGILTNFASNDELCNQITRNLSIVKLLISFWSSDCPSFLLECARLIKIVLKNSSCSSKWMYVIKSNENFFNHILFILNSSINSELLISTMQVVGQLMKLDEDICDNWITNELLAAALMARNEAKWFTNNDIDYFHYLIHLFSTNENGIVALILNFNAVYSSFDEYLNKICDEEPHLIIIGQFYNSLILILPTINVVVANMAADEALNLLQSEPNVLDNLVRLAYTCSLQTENTSIQEIYLEISSLFNTIISITHSNLCFNDLGIFAERTKCIAIHSENYDVQQIKWLRSIDVGACIPQLQAFLSCCTRNESTKLKLLEITQKLNLSYLYEAMTDGKIE